MGGAGGGSDRDHMVFLAGAVSGIAEGLTIQPLEMLKTRFQARRARLGCSAAFGTRAMRLAMRTTRLEEARAVCMASGIRVHGTVTRNGPTAAKEATAAGWGQRSNGRTQLPALYCLRVQAVDAAPHARPALANPKLRSPVPAWGPTRTDPHGGAPQDHPHRQGAHPVRA